MKKQTLATAAALLSLGALHGCGGGGGGGGFGAPLAVAAAPAPAPEVVAVPGPIPDPVPAASSDPTACITAPQPGSTADVGNAYEGVWNQDKHESTKGLMLTSATGESVGFTAASPVTTWPIESTFYGAFNFDVPNSSWQIGSGKVVFYPSTTWASLSGSGTFVPKATLDGSFAAGATAAKPFGLWSYQVANSLAVDSALLTGEWGGSMKNVIGSITVASDRSFTGTSAPTSPLGACALSGSLLPREPGTSKNNLAVTLKATNAATSGQTSCAMLPVQDGVGFVEVNQDTTDGVCKRFMSIYMFLKDSSGDYKATMSFAK